MTEHPPDTRLFTTFNKIRKTTNLEALEKHTIFRVIEKNDGNISKSARELGLTRTALYRRLEKYDL